MMHTMWVRGYGLLELLICKTTLKMVHSGGCFNSLQPLIRPRKINTLFPISCLEKIGSVGREMFFYLNFLCSSK